MNFQTGRPVALPRGSAILKIALPTVWAPCLGGFLSLPHAQRFGKHGHWVFIMLELFGLLVDIISQNPISLMNIGMFNCLDRILWVVIKKFIGAFLAFRVSFLAISKASKTAHSSASRISLFFPIKRLLSFHLSSFWTFQQTAARKFPRSSLDLSAYRSKPALYFLASWRACFLHSIMMSPVKKLPDSIISTGSTPSAGSIEYSTVTCHAN